MEKFDWSAEDMLRSTAAVGALVLETAKIAMAATISKIDAWLCDYGDE